MSHDETIDSLTGQILESRKYRNLSIPTATVHDLLEKELLTGVKPKEALKLAKRKLHNIVASYLGDPDYAVAMHDLDILFSQVPTEEAEKEICQSILMSHASSRERMPHLALFYQHIFSITGQPRILLDLACALHPFSLPWMNLPPQVEYHAYDIHQPRLDLINHYFQGCGLQPLAENRDVLLNPPSLHADVAFIFKETHRMEKRDRGCSRFLWQALQCNWLVVSLPSSSLNGEHDLRAFHRQMVMETIAGLNWKCIETEVGGEMIFCLRIGA